MSLISRAIGCLVCFRSCVDLVGASASAARCTGLRESLRQLSRRRHDRREGTVDPDLRSIPRRQGHRRDRPERPSGRSSSDAGCGASPAACGDAKARRHQPGDGHGRLHRKPSAPVRRLNRFLHLSRGPTRPASGATKPTTIKMADGSSRTGILLGQSLHAAPLLESSNTRFTLLRETAMCIVRSRSLRNATGCSTTALTPVIATARSIKSTHRTFSVSRPVWTLPMPESRPQITPVVVDGIMYVTGWNEFQAVDATTGRVLWTYSEPRHGRDRQ